MVAGWPGLGAIGLTVAVIVPLGARNVIVWVIGVAAEDSPGASQIQNISAPGEVHSTTFEM
jgi:hypothetical protein